MPLTRQPLSTPPLLPQPSSSWWLLRNALKVGCVLGLGIVLLICGFYVWENVQGKRAWEDFVNEAEALGESLDLSVIIPQPVPDQENFAAIPLIQDIFDQERVAAGHPSRLEVMSPKIWELIDSRSWPGKEDGQSAGSWKAGARFKPSDYYAEAKSLSDAEAAVAILETVSEFDDDIAMIMEAARRPYARFPVKWEQKMAAKLPHLTAFSVFSQVLQLKALANLYVGNNQAALDCVLANLRLVKLATDDPGMMNLLVAESSLTTASRPVWEGLCGRVWTDDELIRIEQLLEEMNFAITMLKVIRLERAMICSVLVDQKKFSAFLENQSSIAWFAWYVRLAPRGWGYRNAVTYGRVVQDALLTEQGMQVKRLSITNVQSYARKAVEIRKPPLHPYTVTAGIGMTAYAELFMRAIVAQGTINNARVAIALERYRLRHGEYPKEIDALQPEFLREAPADIVTGESLRYLLRADGRPCIYSVGINRIDDGGQPREDRSLGDWVWQYSMPDGFEIEHFFEKP